MPYRLPVGDAQALIHAELLESARMAAGVRLDFETDATALECQVAVSAVPGDGRPPAPFDVVVDGELVARRQLSGVRTLALHGMRPGHKRIQIWLPQLGFTAIGPVRLSAGAQVAAPPTRPRWITYGSSVTHCTGAAGPTQTWPALVAAANGWDLRCLGFAGQCQLDPVVARFIRDTPADLISVCLGANIYRHTTFSARSLVPAVAGFLQTVRDGHPDTPLVVMTPIVYPDGEREPNGVGLTVADIRALVYEAVDVLRESGYSGLHLVDGLTVLRTEEQSLLVDRLHPGPDGYRLMASRLGPLLQPHLPTSAVAS